MGAAHSAWRRSGLLRCPGTQGWHEGSFTWLVTVCWVIGEEGGEVEGEDCWLEGEELEPDEGEELEPEEGEELDPD